jgi:hypothetical protein
MLKITTKLNNNYIIIIKTLKITIEPNNNYAIIIKPLKIIKKSNNNYSTIIGISSYNKIILCSQS